MSNPTRSFTSLRGALLALLLAMAHPGVAREELLELEQRFLEFQADYVVNPDFTVESTQRVILQALTDNAARDLKEHTFSYSTSIETVDVLEAYTLKADGTKIEVPKGNYQVNINRGNEDGGPIFSDRTRMTVVFPELASGDSIAYTIKRSESEPMFPGQFSIAEYYFDQVAYDSVKVSIRMPESMKPQMQFRGVQERTWSKDGETHIELSYSNPKPVKSTRFDYSVFEWESQDGFAISSFDSYEAIAKAYGERALPRAEPTDRVRKLAAEIVGNEKDSRQQARLIYDWVSRTISYAGNCIGIGAVVPHDLDFILDNRMGDCKDHATLLQALYTSVGIESVQALINSGSSYTLPAIPMVNSVNHVLNYIPEFDQFVDSTSGDIPFDTLAYAVSDKPVLLVEDFREGLRTPPSDVNADWQKSVSTIAINKEGTAAGKVSVELAGLPAVTARALWRQLTRQQEEEWLEGQFSSPSEKGSAAISRDDPQDLVSEYAYSVEFETPGMIPSEGAGGMYLFTPGYSPTPVYAYVSALADEPYRHKVACGNSTSSEEVTYRFPDNLKILAVPEDLSLNENHIEFHASYEQDGNTLRVKRELRDSTPGNVCSADLMNAQRESLRKIEKNLRSQLVYQYL